MSKSVIVPEAYNASWPEGQLSQSLSWSSSFGTTNILKYFDTFRNAHSVSALVGYEYGYSQDEYMTGVAAGLKNGLQVFNGTVAKNLTGTKTELASWSVLPRPSTVTGKSIF